MSSLSQPEHHHQQQQQHPKSHHSKDVLLGTVRRISLLLAFVIGILSQLATFATNFMAIYLTREELNKDNNLKDHVFLIEGCTILSALASTITGTIGLCSVRYLLRKYVIVATTTTASDSSSSNDLHQQLLMDHADNRLVVGSLLGVATAWLLMDFLIMGQPLQLRHFMLIALLLFFGIEGKRIPTSPLRQEGEDKPFEYVVLV